MTFLYRKSPLIAVASCVGAWIEIIIGIPKIAVVSVVSYMGARIEIEPC